MRRALALISIVIVSIAVFAYGVGIPGKGECWWYEGANCWWWGEEKIYCPTPLVTQAEDIQASELLAILDDNQDDIIADPPSDDPINNPLILDLQSKAAYEASHIKGAIWISSLREITKEENLYRLFNALIEHEGVKEAVVYDYNGENTGEVGQRLAASGFPVKNLVGGYIAYLEIAPVEDVVIVPPEEGAEVPIDTGEAEAFVPIGC